MSMRQTLTAAVAVALAASALPIARAVATGCVHNETITVNNAPVGSSFNLLGSPSGLAGQGITTITVTLQPGDGYAELWLLAPPLENAGPPSINLFPLDTSLDCNDIDVFDATYLQIGSEAPFHPTFGGSGSLDLDVKCNNGDYQILKGVVARSTDIEGDLDTDEDDVDALRAAIGTVQPQFDLDFSGGAIDAADLAIIVAEAKRRVVQNYALSAWNDADCYGTQIPMPTSGYKMVAPNAPVVTLSVLNSTTTRLSWPAVADDPSGAGATQPASGYEIRRSESTITDANYAAATIVATAGPGALGTNVLMDVSRPTNTSCSWYYAVKAKDDVDNWSAISNVTSDKIDTTAPSTTTLTGLADLNAIKLTWTAPGDDGSVGQAAAYDLRYSTSVITTANFNAAASVPGTPNPGPAGTAECLVVSNLDACTNYYFALKTSDDCGNISAMSNSLLKKTRCFGIISVSCGGAKASPDEGSEITSLQARGPSVVHSGFAEFELSVPAQLAGALVRAAIYDVRGRVVRTLPTDGAARAGVSQLHWDLRNEQGGAAASGVYYLRAQVGDQGVRREVVVAR